MVGKRVHTTENNMVSWIKRRRGKETKRLYIKSCGIVDLKDTIILTDTRSLVALFLFYSVRGRANVIVMSCRKKK